MIRLFITGDGPRDAATLPHLISTILETPVQAEFRPWARLGSGGHGYGRKLRFARRQAIDSKQDGLVAVVDRDKAKRESRLNELRAAREADRQSSPPFPTAVGEAAPHAEAWLIDDPHAVRECLDLESDHKIPTIRTTRDPKGTLGGLIKESRRRDDPIMEILAHLALTLVPSRCLHKRETGFETFEEDVHAEFDPLRPSGDRSQV